ncbi:heterotrimeric G protein alpha subunit B [Radiomyces spectabilis]|uniref:heterotrimeric G protein alpha subunit B n=1 Tax=Radiomyces spectabilis TaxID=64574 RepID=UPI002220C4E8|nr:heterotrimeric G protein alpha subunit B [Radiomyces spectabilis]KAI8381194.1 heterotrimeric G protein alpha subunit B [Radiomyces spectabilis]
MGCCVSVPAVDEIDRLHSHQIDSQLRAERIKLRNEVKLLLLGAGESGKSTIVKQMKLIHDGGFTREERLAYRTVIFSNTIQSMRVILEAMQERGIALSNPSKNGSCFDLIARQPTQVEYTVLPMDITRAIQSLWGDHAVQTTYKRSNEYQLNDSASYYFDCIERIGEADYVPTNQDVLRSRVKTTGISETRFTIDELTYRMLDVGGQRSERKKWIHCFENVKAIIFLVAISEYDQNLMEDENVSRMDEAFILFESVRHSRWFSKTSIILFLNKTDIFRQKLSYRPLQNYFPDYLGNNYDAACEYFRRRFENLNRVSNEKQVYTHFTCATDTEQIRFVMSAVNDIVLREHLRTVGLL